MKPVRVRFAPSPTGPLHIGGLRTALYNYLFARRHGGQFILRIEDTDQKRYVEQAEPYIKDALSWVGLTPDEGPDQGGTKGPYRQSERSKHYQESIQSLIEKGHAYRAYDTADEIESMREAHGTEGHSAKYDHRTRMHMRNDLTLSSDEKVNLLEAKTPYVVRLKVEPGRTITFYDEIRGEVSFSSDELDDKVLMKSDGLPTYHMANVVDDLHMEISHVIRGEEWLSSTAHHVLLYQALGHEEARPVFAHLPLILKPTGKGKLSKRDGAKLGIPVFPLDYEDGEEVFPGFREMGFLPDAVVNFLALLGWHPGGDDEVMSIDDMAARFDLSQVHKGGARFDMDKATWFNQQYIQSLDVERLSDLLWPAVAPSDAGYDHEAKMKIIAMFQPRIKTLHEFESQSAFFFEPPSAYDEKTLRKKWKGLGITIYEALVTAYGSHPSWSATELKSTLEAIMEAHEASYGHIMPLLRIALSGTTKGPDLFEVMEILGQEEVMARLNAGKDAFHNIAAT